MMGARRQFAGLVRKLERAEKLGELRSEAGVGSARFHWKVRVEPAEPEGLVGLSAGVEYWKVFVGPGTVNDRMAAISYLREQDPRGWKMPEDYRGIARAKKYYGENFRILDRLLTEVEDPPYLLAQAPVNEDDLGDFARVPDDERRPPALRSREAWNYDVYEASVFLTGQPGRYARVENLAGYPVPQQPERFRVAIAPKVPRNPLLGVAAFKELARLYLLRDPMGELEDVVLVQQRCFWSLWTAYAQPYQEGSPGLVDAMLQFLASLAASGSEVDFWTAV